MLAMTVMTGIVGLACCFAVYTSVMLAESTLIGGRLESELKARIEDNLANNASTSMIYTDNTKLHNQLPPSPRNTGN